MKVKMARCVLMTGVLLALTTISRAGAEDAVKAKEAGDYKKALKEFVALADNGDDVAMVSIGLMYHRGEGVEQDYGKAMDWYLKAFEKDNGDAFSNIGVMYRDGLGVGKNKKIAYCLFLITHVCSLGTESTQIRANGCLRRITPDMTKEELVECFNYTPQYISEYVKSKGTIKGIPEKYKPAKDRPAIKDMPWWVAGELDFLPEDQRPKLQPRPAMTFKTLAYELRTPPAFAMPDARLHAITENGISSFPLKTANVAVKDKTGSILAGDTSVSNDRWCFIALETNRSSPVMVFQLDLPAKQEGTDWSPWLKPAFMEPDSMAIFGLCGGRRSKQAYTNLPPAAIELRFRVSNSQSSAESKR